MALSPKARDHEPQPAAGRASTTEVDVGAWAADRAGVVVETVLDAAGVPPAETATFLERLTRTWHELVEAFDAVYGAHPDRDAALDAVVGSIARHWASRSAALRALDAEREARPDWFQAPDMIGYVLYVDRFAGSLPAVLERVDHLSGLGVRYVHLMPLLKPREGDNDGGYAVVDYAAVRPDLGTMDDLEAVAGELRARGMSTCIDLVINHTAAEHPWALAAAAGDPTYSAFYRIHPDRTEPDAYERTLPEVFPDFAPGNFTQLPDGRWVWTTFNRWQWDLRWENPWVFAEILGILLDLAGRGIDVFRLDAVAFMWKRLGTNCQNQPEVHWILRALRACARVAAPAVIFKAEAIVGPDDLAPYLGVAAPGVPAGRESDVAYHNSLMVQYWSSLAARDTRLMTSVLSRFPHKPSATAWGTYIRCHDDIGWAITEEDAEAVGWTGAPHRAFLSAFYAGTFPGSFSRGVIFQHNPATGDSRISGTFASLAGLERALERGDAGAVDLAIARMLAGHALIMGWDGIPLLYMGDEIGLLNHWRYVDEPGHESDSRWVHRPPMDWALAALRDDPVSVPGRLFAGIRRLIDIRARSPQLHAAAPLQVLDLGDSALFGYLRGSAEAPLVAVHNFTEVSRTVAPAAVGATLPVPAWDLLSGRAVAPGDSIELGPYGTCWLVTSRPALPPAAQGADVLRPADRWGWNHRPMDAGFEDHIL